MNLSASAIRWNDAMVKLLSDLQVMQGNPYDIGGLLDVNKGFTEPAAGTRLADVFLAAYYNPQSRYHGQMEMLTRAKMAMEHLLFNTHEDGTIDLLETNYHDSTGNAFCTHLAGYTHRLIRTFSQHTPLEDEIQALLLLFLQNSARAMINGGFHTPNHRWVMAAALALCYKELGDDACRAAMQEYLDEGIDNDDEGEYTEHSVGIYDIVCDLSLLMIYREMDMPELIAPVMRNLEKLTYYIEPDGSIATLNSRRQDFGKKLYAFPYLLDCLLALKVPHDETDARYQRLMGLAEYLYQRYLDHEDKLTWPPDASQFLTQFMLEPSLAEVVHPSIPLQTVYQKLFPLSGVARARMGKAALTLVRQRPVFCKLQIGELTLMLRMASNFFGTGQLISTDIEPIENGWRLQRVTEGGYMRPLGKAAGTIVWEDIPREKRQWVNMQHLTLTMDVLVFENRIELALTVDGNLRLPWKLEGILSPGGELTTQDGKFTTGEGDTAILEHGFTYTLGADEITWSDGLKQHVFAEMMRNSLPKEAKAFTIYNTGLAPQGHHVTLTWK